MNPGTPYAAWSRTHPTSLTRLSAAGPLSGSGQPGDPTAETDVAIGEQEVIQMDRRHVTGRLRFR